MTDTMPVTFRLTGLERIHAPGKLVALAVVELEIGGAVLTLQGVQVLRLPNGQTECRAPCFRSSTGRWLPAVMLPPGLASALAAEVLAAFADPRTGSIAA